MFVEISLDREKDDPQRIFESLNSTGLELSQADLIRNYILMGLNRKEQNKIFQNYWEVIEKLAKALLDRLLYKCQLIQLQGKSYRMQNRKTIFNDCKN